MKIKTIGIIGGFGPEATARFFLTLVRECRRAGLTHQPHCIVWNVPIPDRLEQKLLRQHEGIEHFTPFLIQAAHGLVNAGAQLIVLPCNTLHALQKHIQKAIPVHFVSIIEATKTQLLSQNIHRIGLLGTSETVKHNLFKQQLPHLLFHMPSAPHQKRLDQAIFTFVVQHDPQPLQSVLEVCMREFAQQGIKDILLACTDFHAICPNIPGIRIHDTLTALIWETMRHAGIIKQSHHAQQSMV